jgi:glycine oxidase
MVRCGRVDVSTPTPPASSLFQHSRPDELAGPAPGVKQAIPDVGIIGGGVIGLSVALEAARRRLAVTVFDAGDPGQASGVAAGLLAPSIGALAPDARRAFATANAELRAQLLEFESSGVVVDYRPGLIEAFPSGSRPDRVLSPEHRNELAPGLAPDLAAVLHPGDGSVDPRRLVAVLRRLASATGVRFLAERVAAISPGPSSSVHLDAGSTIPVGQLVVAAGAWLSRLKGLPAGLAAAVTPLRGQVIAVHRPDIQPRTAVIGPAGYVVPRAGLLLVGATAESAGFSPEVTSAATESLLVTLAAFFPEAAGSRDVVESWAGLRPMTSDGLPMVGRIAPDVIVACGHGRNGVLLSRYSAIRVVNMLLDAGAPGPVEFDPQRASLRRN